MTFKIKRNDTSPSATFTLENEDGAVNLTGATVRFYMGSVVASAATIDNATGGIVSYNWIAADTANSGVYKAEFEVVYSDGTKETFPNDGFITIQITPDIGEPA